MATEEQWAWVGRVLGIEQAGAGGTAARAARPRGKLVPIWIEAKEEVDVGIGQLQNALRETGDEDLDQIAEFGLYGATSGEAVRLMAALRDADAADGAPDKAASARARVANAVENYREFLDAAPIVDLIEDNPFGVSVPMRRRLGSALDELERQIAA